MRLLAAYLSTAAVFAALDLVWLGSVASGFYRSQLGALLSDTVNIAAALLFYAIYVAGIVYFAVLPALDGGGAARALWLGMALGFVAYATYDLTNYATLKGFPLAVVAVDMAWGTIVTGIAAAAGAAVAARV